MCDKYAQRSKCLPEISPQQGKNSNRKLTRKTKLTNVNPNVVYTSCQYTLWGTFGRRCSNVLTYRRLHGILARSIYPSCFKKRAAVTLRVDGTFHAGNWRLNAHITTCILNHKWPSESWNSNSYVSLQRKESTLNNRPQTSPINKNTYLFTSPQGSNSPCSWVEVARRYLLKRFR